jgi:hypothetical protein
MKKTVFVFLFLQLIFVACNQQDGSQSNPESEKGSIISTYAGDIEFQDQTLSKATAEEMRRMARLQRASQLVCWAMPAASFYQMVNVFQENLNTDPSEPAIGLFQGYDGVYVWLTANVMTPYTISFLDLAKTGPVVVEIPGGGVYGVANNAWQEPIKEINSGQEETLLFVGPGQEVPDNFEGEVIQSATFQMVYFYRVLGIGPEAEALKTGVKAYRLKDKDNPPATKFITYEPKQGDRVVIGTPPEDMQFWELVNDYVQAEPMADRDRFFYAWLQDLGIEKGKPFEPTEYQKAILEESLPVGFAMAQSTAFDSFFPDARYGEDSGWDKVLAGLDTKVDLEHYSMFNQRLSYTYEAATTSEGMTKFVEGKGSAYLGSYYDADGDALMGENDYSLKIEPNPPVANFWSITVYDARNRLIIRNEIRKSDLSSRTEGLQTNEDGSIDLYFGPTAPEGKENNWVQTNPGESWFMYMRFYGPLKPYDQQTYQMNKVQKIK